MTDDANQLGRNILYLLGTHRMTANALAVKLGGRPAQPTISRLINGEMATPRDQTLKPIAEFFNVELHDLRYVDLAHPDNADALRSGRSVPVVTRDTLMRIDFETGIRPDVLKTERHRAPLWTTDPDAFLFPVEDNRMAPRFYDGEFVRVEPNKLVAPQDDVLVRTEREVFLAELLAQRQDGLRLRRYTEQFPFMVRTAELRWFYRALHPVRGDEVPNPIPASER